MIAVDVQAAPRPKSITEALRACYGVPLKAEDVARELLRMKIWMTAQKKVEEACVQNYITLACILHFVFAYVARDSSHQHYFAGNDGHRAF